MDPIIATKLLRLSLDKNALPNWKIKLNKYKTNSPISFDITDKSVMLDASYVDNVNEIILSEIISHTINQIKVEVKNPTIKAHKKLTFTDKCKTCGKIAKVKSRIPTNGYIITTYECNHVEFIESSSTSPFEKLVFDINPLIPNCKHTWGKELDYNKCQVCDAKRLYPFQVISCRSLEESNGRLAILDEMGLGKTIQAIAYLYYNIDTSSPYLWVTKAKVKYQHLNELVRILGINNMPFVLSDGKANISFLKNTKIKGLIISYDTFRRLDIEELKSFGFKLLVLDEVQAIKNPESSRTKAIRELAQVIPKIIPLSGSFWKNRGSEAFVMLNMLDPKMFWSFKAFKDNYVAYHTDPSSGKEKEGGFRNPQEFRDKIAHIAIRRERKEVFPNFTDINRTKLICEVPEHARKIYDEEVKKIQSIMKDAMIDGTEDSFTNNRAINESLMRMKQIVGLAKVPTACEYLEEFLDSDDKKKIVVFVHHIDVGNIIYHTMMKYCEENGYNWPLYIKGGTSPEESRRLVLSFKDSRIIILSTLGAGEGIDGLQHDCNDILFVERQWNPANEEQAEGRLLRIGQKETFVNSVYALGDKTVDIDLDGIIHRKRIDFHQSMNKLDMPVWNEQSILKSVIESIMKVKV